MKKGWKNFPLTRITVTVLWRSGRRPANNNVGVGEKRILARLVSVYNTNFLTRKRAFQSDWGSHCVQIAGIGFLHAGETEVIMEYGEKSLRRGGVHRGIRLSAMRVFWGGNLFRENRF